MDDDKKKKALLKARIVISVCVLLPFFLFGIYYVLNKKFSEQPQCGTKDVSQVSGLCGNAVMIPGFSELTLQDYNQGKMLFKQNCAVCHSESDRKLSGPGMKGAYERAPDSLWLQKYIFNADSLRKSGDPYAVKLYQEYDSLGMPPFRGLLNDKEMNQLILFLKNCD